MPKELIELSMFNSGTICNPSVTDIPPEAASDSLNIDPMSEDGKLKGIPIDVKLEDDVGHEVNTLVQNSTDPSKHDLISYKNSNNIVYKSEHIYGGSSTEASLGTLTASSDEVAMEAMQGAVYLGQGTAVLEEPQWIGRLDHGQWQATPADTLVMEEDTMYPPNAINESSSGCTDGSNVFVVDGGAAGSYDRQAAFNDESVVFASGEITKIRISDGKVLARSDQVLGYVNSICLSPDGESLWALCSEKWNISNYVTTFHSQTFHIYKINPIDLTVSKDFLTDLDVAIETRRPGEVTWDQMTNDTDNTGNRWEDEDSYWDGQGNYPYQNAFSSIIQLTYSDGDAMFWVCTTAGAIFNCKVSDFSDDTLSFTDRTPIGLGYQYQTESKTEEYMPPGGANLNQTGGFYKNDKSAWLFPEWFNGSLIQLNNSDDYVGMYLRNGQSSETIQFDLGGSDEAMAFGDGFIFVIHPTTVAGTFIDGTNSRVYKVNDTSLRSGTNGIREINNMMFQPAHDLKKSAYSVIKNWTISAMEINTAEFDHPNYNATHGGDITVKIVEGDDTTQTPIRINDTTIVGVPSDVNISVSDANSGSSTTRNYFRKFTKYITTDGWDTHTRTQFGPPLYLSQRFGETRDHGKISQTTTDSSFHVANTGYFYKFSFIFDGFQESALGAARHIWSIGKQVRIPFSFNDDNFPKRVTGVRIYRATSISNVNRKIGGFYHFVGEITISDIESGSLDTGSYLDGLSASVNEGDEHADNYRLCSFTDNGASGATYETMSGLLEGMEDSNVQYKLSTQLNDSLFMANCAHHSQDTATNILYKSLPYKPSCVNWAFDLLRLPWVPTSIQSFNGRVYVFNESETLKVDPNSMFIEDAFTGAGCLTPDAVAVSDYGMVYCDNNNIYHHTGAMPIAIGDSILTSDSGNGYLDLLDTSSYSPKVIFDAKRKCFIVYVTTTRAWSYNVVRKVWNLWENPNLIAVLNGKQGEVLGIDSSGGDLYQMYKSSTLKDNWHWTSKRISMQHKTQKKKFYEATVAYTGDGSGDTPTVTVYYDYSSDSTTTTDGGSEANIVKRNLAKEKKRLIQLKVQPGDSSTEVDSIGITFRRFPKLIETS